MLNGVKLDLDGIENGRWFNLGKTRLKIAHSSNKRFKNAIASKLVNGSLTIKEACESLAEGILVDWDQLHHTDGTNVPYSIDMATYALITNNRLRDFVEVTSSDLENFEEV